MLQWPFGNSTNPGSRKNLCDPEELWTAERLVDEFPVALSQHFPRIWSCLCTKFCNRKSIFLSVIMCTERMFVFADLSSPALDSSTEHLKVEITQDCRQVYWAAIQWHSESSAMLFPVHCSGQAMFFSWSTQLGGHCPRQILLSNWCDDWNTGKKKPMRVRFTLSWVWTTHPVASTIEMDSMMSWCPGKETIGKERSQNVGIQVNLHKRELSFHNTLSACNALLKTCGPNIKPRQWWMAWTIGLLRTLDYRFLGLARLHCLFYWFFSIDFQAITKYCCSIVASTSPSIVLYHLAVKSIWFTKLDVMCHWLMQFIK